MKKWFFASLFLLGYLVYGIFLNNYNVEVIQNTLTPQPHKNFYDYKGAINIHTSQGAGSKEPLEILEMAQSSLQDFIVFTDRNALTGRPSLDGYFGRTLSIDGNSLGYLDSRVLIVPQNHLESFETLSDAQIRLTDWASEKRSDTKNHLLFLSTNDSPWTGPFPLGFDGLEVVNLKSVWETAWSKSKIKFLLNLLIYPFNGRLSLLRLYQEPNRELDMWGEISSSRRVSGVLGLQATGRLSRFFGIEPSFPSYELLFQLASNHILLPSELTGDYKKDRTKVIEALGNGQLYFSLDFLGNPVGFAAYLTEGDEVYPLGSEIKFRKKLVFNIDLPRLPQVPFEVLIYRNGMEVQKTSTLNTELAITEPGAYSAKIRVKPKIPIPGKAGRWFTWIYTNPIYIQP